MYNLLISAAAAIVSFFLVTIPAGFHYWCPGFAVSSNSVPPTPMP